MNYISEYYSDITEGRIKANRWIKKEYAKYIPIINDEDPEYWFSEKHADHVIYFCENFCYQSKDKFVGQKIKLLPWEKAMLSAIYGCRHRDTGRRMITDVILEIAKKNGKSSLLSCIIMYEMNKKGQEIYSASATKDMASMIFNECANMLKQSPELQTRLKKRQYDIINTVEGNFSRFAPLPNTPDALDGKFPTVVVLDEFWLLQIPLYTILKNGQILVDEPLFIMIGTAGNIREGLYDEQISYAKQVITGVVQNRHQLSLLYELDDPEEINDPSNWIKANPSMGELIKLEKLQLAYEQAKNTPKTLNEWKTKHLNIIGKAGIDNYYDFDKFNNCNEFDIKRFKGQLALGGLDLSRTRDLTAFNVTWYDKKEKKFYVKTQYWCTEDFYNQMLDDSRLSASFRYWYEKGYLRVAGKNLIDYQEIVKYVNDLVKKGIILRYIGYDSYSASYLVHALDDEGFRIGDCLNPVIQGYKTLSVPFQYLASQLNSRNIIYSNPMDEWCISNVSVEKDRNGNLLPSRRSNLQKVDGHAVLLNAFVMLTQHENEFI